jgi:ankyrin repeat protein
MRERFSLCLSKTPHFGANFLLLIGMKGVLVQTKRLPFLLSVVLLSPLSGAYADTERFVEICKGGSAGELSELLGEGSALLEYHDPTFGTCLHMAATRRDAELVHFLLKSGANPDSLDAAGNTPLIVASEVGAWADRLIMFAFGAAASNKQLRQHLGHRQGVSVRRTAAPLKLAWRGELFGKGGIVTGANISVSPFYFLHDSHAWEDIANDPKKELVSWYRNEAIEALSAFHQSVVRLLIDAGGQVDFQNNAGLSALHNAAYYGDTGLLNLLLDATGGDGYDILVADDVGRTALHLATSAGQEAAISALLRAARTMEGGEGAAGDSGTGLENDLVGAENDQGLTALDLARALGFQRIGALLQGATPPARVVELEVGVGGSSSAAAATSGSAADDQLTADGRDCDIAIENAEDLVRNPDRFASAYLAGGRPVLVRGVTKLAGYEWPAVERWTRKALTRRCVIVPL